MDIGDLAPDFCLQSTGGDVCLADLHAEGPAAVSYTHLTLPTNREV